MMIPKLILRIITIFTGIFTVALSGFAQEQAPTDVSILESRFVTTQPIVGETFKYFLKFDYKEDLSVYPVEHFTENGITIIEQKRLEPQEFQGKVIEQYALLKRKDTVFQDWIASLKKDHYIWPEGL